MMFFHQKCIFILASNNDDFGFPAETNNDDFGFPASAVAKQTSKYCVILELFFLLCRNVMKKKVISIF